MEDATPHDIPTTTVTQHIADPQATQPTSSSNDKEPQHSSSSSQSSNLCSTETSSKRASESHLIVEEDHLQGGKSMEIRRNKRLSRPKLGSRKSSGSIIVHRDSSVIELHDEEYDDDDARAMSPRRTSDEIDRMGDDARQALEQQAHALQSNLLEILERVDSVKSEHEKLEGGNKFLQSYIGELMQTSKITSTGAAKSKKGRSGK